MLNIFVVQKLPTGFNELFFPNEQHSEKRKNDSWRKDEKVTVLKKKRVFFETKRQKIGQNRQNWNFDKKNFV